MTEKELFKLHKAEDSPEKQAALLRMVAEDAASQKQNRGELLTMREAEGLVTVKCKCGTESVLDSKRPAKPAALCGSCGKNLG